MRQSVERAAAWPLLLLIAGLLLVPLPHEAAVRWVAKLFDLSHIPLFFLVFLVFWSMLGRRALLAVVLSIAVAGGLELLQIPVGRDPEWGDFVRGVLGSCIGGIAMWGVAPRVEGWQSQEGQRSPIAAGRRRTRIALRLVAVAILLVWPVADAAGPITDAWQARLAFPVLADFQSPRALYRWMTDDAVLTRVAASSPGGEEWSGRIEFAAKNKYSAVVLFPIVRDWSGYSRMQWEFTVDERPLRLAIAVRDGRKVLPPARRFHFEDLYQPGWHRVSIDLKELAAGSQAAPVDVSAVESCHLIADHLKQPQTLRLHRIYLE